MIRPRMARPGPLPETEATRAGAARGRRGGALSYALHVLLAACGFFGAGAAVRPLVPWPSEYGLREKFEHVAEHGDQYDVIFLGSSRTWRGIMPERFDKELALRGVELRSFNFGVGGMRIWELDYVLHRVLALEPAKLRWIFVEEGDWDPRFPSELNTFASRSVFWHDLGETREALAATFTVELAPWERLRLALTHVQLYLWRLTSYGQGRAIVRHLRGIETVDFGRERETGSVLVHQGFQTQAALFPPEAARDVADYERRVAALPAANDAPVDLERVYTGAIERQYAAARARGVELIVLVPPSIDGTPVPRRLHAAGVIPALFDFNDPERYPDLFRAETRFSPDHLNLNGAKALTDVLAKTFARHLRGEERD